MSAPSNTNTVLGMTSKQAGLLSMLAVAGMAHAARFLARRSAPTSFTRPSALGSKPHTPTRQTSLTTKEARKERRAKQLEAAYTEACRRRRPVFSQPIGSCVLREYEEASQCRGAPILEGFPSQGLAAQLVAQYLVEQLELPLVGEVHSDMFPALGVVSHYVTSGGCRIYGDRRLVVFVSDYKIEGDEAGVGSLYKDLCGVIHAFASRHESKLILSTEGLPRKSKLDKADYDTQEDMLAAMLKIMEENRVARMERLKLAKDPAASPSSDEKQPPNPPSSNNKSEEDEDEDLPEDGEVRFITNDTELALMMKDAGHQPLRDAVISGVTGTLLASAGIQDIAGICLLSPYDENLPDVATAVPLIQAIDKMLGEEISVDTFEMSKEVKRMEAELQKTIQSLVPGNSPEKALSMYM